MPIDPRRITNIHGLDPCHLAQPMQRRRMARLLRPQLPIGRLFTAEDLDSTRWVGPSASVCQKVSGVAQLDSCATQGGLAWL